MVDENSQSDLNYKAGRSRFIGKVTHIHGLYTWKSVRVWLLKSKSKEG